MPSAFMFTTLATCNVMTKKHKKTENIYNYVSNEGKKTFPN